jgi:hypothetical protein
MEVAVTVDTVAVTPASATLYALTNLPMVAPVAKPVPVMITGTLTAPAPTADAFVVAFTNEVTVGAASTL